MESDSDETILLKVAGGAFSSLILTFANSFIYNKKSYDIYFLSSISLISVFFSILL